MFCRRPFISISILASLMVGCSDPGMSKLSEGDKVRLVANFRDSDGKPSKTLALTTNSLVKFEIINSGTEAVVVDDSGGDSDREVTVHIVEGDRKGATGTVSRRQCHPFK